MIDPTIVVSGIFGLTMAARAVIPRWLRYRRARRTARQLPAARVHRLPEYTEGSREVSAATPEQIPSRREPGPRTVRLSSEIPYANVSEVGTVAPSIRDITQAGARMDQLRELHERGDITDKVFHREMRRVSEPVNRALDDERTFPRRPAGWAGHPMPGEPRAAYVRPEPTEMPGELESRDVRAKPVPRRIPGPGMKRMG